MNILKIILLIISLIIFIIIFGNFILKNIVVGWNANEKMLQKILNDKTARTRISIKIKKHRKLYKEFNKRIKAEAIIIKKSDKKNSIVDNFILDKKKEFNRSFKILLISALINCYAYIIFDYKIKIGVLILLCTLILFNIILQLVVSYRINKGYYGTNYAEARELLIFLIENNDKNDKNSGMRIFDELDVYCNETAKSNSKVVGNLQY